MRKTIKSESISNLKQNRFEFKNVPDQPKRTIENLTRGELLWSKPNQRYRQHPLNSESSKNNYAGKALVGIQEISHFSYLFFSQENIQEIQKLLRYNVYKNTKEKFIIDNQSETELVVIMRAVYLEHLKGVPSDFKIIKKELEKLNSIVIKVILPDIISQVKQHKGYIKDASVLAIPLEVPKNPSIKGENNLRSISDVLIGDDSFFGK